MTTTILLTALIVALLGGILLLLPRMARPTVPFGVRVPDSHVDAPAVRQAASAYYRGVIVTMLVVAVALIAITPITSPGVVLTAASLLPIAAWLVPYLSARRTVLAAKRSERWYEGVRQTVAADTSWRVSPPVYPWQWAIPAVVIALATVAIGIAVYPSLPDRIATRFNLGGDPVQFTNTTAWSAFGLVGIALLLTALLLGVALLALRSKADITATDPHASADQYRRYAGTMAKAVLAVAAGMNLTLLIVALMSWDVAPANVGWQIASLLPSLVVFVGLIVVSIRTGQSGHRLASATSDEHADPATAHHDDDAHWIAGLIYVNRDDPSLFVPKRFGGVGWTINLARPAAWVLTVALLAIAVGVPIWAVGQA